MVGMGQCIGHDVKVRFDYYEMCVPKILGIYEHTALKVESRG